MARQRNLDTEAKLIERVKELTCLYKVGQIANAQFDTPLHNVLQSIVELLPPAWQYPEIALGRIILDENVYFSENCSKSEAVQSAPIIVRGICRGRVEVIYLEEREEQCEGPFLQEERSLIDALAREISGIVERYQIRSEKAELEEQLRHSDRLATLGQLAAGVAHELNEPLGNILGFAQLAQKTENLPESTKRDLEKIVSACLHSREIISKLRFFARQMPVQRKEVDLNEIILERTLFIESRCSKSGIEIVKRLDPDLPNIYADPNQLHQILINLMINSVQAMPEGGQLILQTAKQDDHVLLVVKDNGIGIPADVLPKIFMPFFTTKDVNEGTGLGLSVVYDIVKSHGGKIIAESTPNNGCTFSVTLPVNNNRLVVQEFQK